MDELTRELAQEALDLHQDPRSHMKFRDSLDAAIKQVVGEQDPLDLGTIQDVTTYKNNLISEITYAVEILNVAKEKEEITTTNKQTEALALLEKIAKKPKHYFIYDMGESYAHELDKENDNPDIHIGGVEDVSYCIKGNWHSRSSISVTVKVEHNAILTSKGYIEIKDSNGNTIAEVPYGLDETKFIMDIWEERFHASDSHH